MTFEITQRLQAQQGWTDSSLLGLILEYLENQQDDTALEEFLQEKAAAENEGAAGVLGFTPQGVPRLTLEDKLAGFVHCTKDGSWEDALGHLFDLLHYLCPKMTVQVLEGGQGVKLDAARPQEVLYGTAAYFALLHSHYGQHPTQLRGPHEPQEAQADGGA